jgi:hypothetical protein
MEAAIEPHVREFMKVAAKFTDVLTEVEQISDYEDPQSKALYEKYHTLNTQKSAESQKITQAAAKAVKMIIAELSPENAAELQRRMDVSRLQTLASMLRFVEDPVISDLLRISTLTREQRSSMRALVRKTQSETIGQFKEMLSAYEMWAAGKEVTTEIDYEALMAKHLKITRELREKLSGELTPQQKIAFEEGIEPPLSWNARRSGGGNRTCTVNRFLASQSPWCHLQGMIARGFLLARCLIALLGLSITSTVAFGQEVLAMSRYNQRDPNWVGEIDLVREHFKLDQEQLSIVRTMTSGTMHEYLMQRRLYDRRREDYESPGADAQDQGRPDCREPPLRPAPRRDGARLAHAGP